MAENIFASKSKADLIEIVRFSGILPIGKAQKMRKQELAAFLAEQMRDGSGKTPSEPDRAATEEVSVKPAAEKESEPASAEEVAENAPRQAEEEGVAARETRRKNDNRRKAGKAKKEEAPETPAEVPAETPAPAEDTPAAVSSENTERAEEAPETETSEAAENAPKRGRAAQRGRKPAAGKKTRQGKKQAEAETAEAISETPVIKEEIKEARPEVSETVKPSEKEAAPSDVKEPAEKKPEEAADSKAKAEASGKPETERKAAARDRGQGRKSFEHKANPRKPRRAAGKETAAGEAGKAEENKENKEDETLTVDEFSARPRPSRRQIIQNRQKETRGKESREKETQEKEPREVKTEQPAVTREGKETGETAAPEKEETVSAREEEKEQVKEHVQQKSSGVLELMPDGYGFLRNENYIQGPSDVYVSAQLIRRFGLRAGDYVKGILRSKRDQDRYQALSFVEEVNGLPPEKMLRRPHFERLTPIYPTERYKLETERRELSTRIIDLFSPIGKGQRGMIVSPPKAGKTILLQKIANAISKNNPEAKLIVLLIDERPEEVTDMQRRIDGEVVYSTFDKMPENHVKITELVLERAKRLVELGEDVVILLDSMTRMARAYNITITPTGRTLSGGLDPGALFHPKRFFGAARNIENGGSLTIVATSLVETGSRMDEVIFEEFKGTGNMEVYLDRKLSEKRIFPAIDINRSGTRREELLLTPRQLEAVWGVRKAFSQLDTANVTELIINLLLKTKDNEHMIDSLNISLKDKAITDAMRLPHDLNHNGNGNK